MIVRQARAGDAAAICGIWNAIIRDTAITFTTEVRTESAVAAEIAERDGAFLVAEAVGSVVGFATYSGFRAGPGYARTKEHSIHLAPAARGQGAGLALMLRLEQAAEAEGVHSLIAGISGANPGAVAFHAKLGFVEVARIPEVGFKAGRWLDLVVMQKFVRIGQQVAPDFASDRR